MVLIRRYFCISLLSGGVSRSLFTLLSECIISGDKSLDPDRAGFRRVLGSYKELSEMDWSSCLAR